MMKLYSIAAPLLIISVQGFAPSGRSPLLTRLTMVTLTPPSMAQTHMQGPASVTGSGKPLTKAELDAVREELDEIKKKYNLKEPVRSFMEDPDIKWRFGGAPDYSLSNLYYLKERSKQHAEGSLEQIVENLVKTWEMERSHKTDPKQHMTVDQEKFRISANGGKAFDNVEANQVGNYNVLLNSCPLWESDRITWETSHDMFHNAFAAFPWEVLEVYSGPPKVAFTWRHWGTFTGTYEDNRGKGELVEMYGFGTAVVNDNLQLQDVEIFFNANDFIKVLRGQTEVKDTNGIWKSNHGCPFTALTKAITGAK